MGQLVIISNRSVTKAFIQCVGGLAKSGEFETTILAMGMNLLSTKELLRSPRSTVSTVHHVVTLTAL